MNLGDISVKISTDLSDFSSGMRQATSQMNQVTMAMVQSMKQAQQAIKVDFQTLTSSASDYAGRTDEFMGKLQELGLKQKNISDQLISSNEQMKASFVQSVGEILARSNQADKIAENLNRIGEPLRGLDAQLLQIGSGLENMAKQGAPAVVALKELGPTANMKQLRDQIQLINQGIARMQALSLASGIVLLGFTAGLIHLSNVIDGRLKESFAEFKATWIEALTPFVTAWTTMADAVLKVGTFIGELGAKFAELSPTLSAAGGMFMYLFTAMTFLLSPLAIGISRAGSMAVAFNTLWMTLKPLALGFLSVAGTAAIISAALVALGAVVYKLWTTSDGFRTAVIDSWNKIKSSVLGAVEPLKPAIDNLGKSFIDLVTAFTGKKPTIDGFWNGFGQIVGTTIRFIVDTIMPLIVYSIENFVRVLTVTLDAVTAIFEGIKFVWDNGGKAIVAATLDMATNVKDAFLTLVTNALGWGRNLMSNFIDGFKSMFGTLRDTVSSAAETISDYLGFSSPTKKGEGSKSDKWIPNLVSMMDDGLQKGIPKLEARLSDMALSLSPSYVMAGGASFDTAPAASGGNVFHVTIHGTNADEIWSKFDRELQRRGGRF